MSPEPQAARQPDGGAALTVCAAAGAASLALRALYLKQSWRIDLSVPQAFVAAEGQMGIVARHILRGARLVFPYYGYYHGTLECHLAALAFWLFGESMTVLRLVPILLAVLWVPLTGLLAARLYGKRAGYLAAALMALPAQFVFEWGCTAWAGDSRIVWLLMGMYLLLLLLERVTRLRVAALGFVAGISVWASLLSLGTLPVYALALLMWIRLTRRQWALLLIAGAMGMAPLIYGNVRQPLISVRTLAARTRWSFVLRHRPAQRAEEEEARFFQSTPLFQLLGAQPRHDGKWSVTGSASALFLTVGALAGGWVGYRRRRRDPLVFRGAMLMLTCFGVGVASGLPGFFGEPVARYSITLYPAACVLAAGWVVGARPRLAVPVVALLAVANAVQLAEPIHAEARTPNHVIIDAILEHGLHYGFGADNMYDLVFDSGERLIIEPVEWTWVPQYHDMVLAAERPFYLYREDQQSKVSYQQFMAYLAKHGIRYQRFDVEDYHVLYNFEPVGSITAHAIAEMRDEIRRRKGRVAAPVGEPGASAWGKTVGLLVGFGR
ncbi:MAG: hypothetical protein ABSA52_08795 [Candidatus Binatia bacterium]|jgi:hypothetical protein